MTNLTSAIAELTAPLNNPGAAEKSRNTATFALQQILSAVTAREAEVIRRCAIPRRFDRDTFAVLLERIEGYAELFQWITAYSFVRKLDDRYYAYHEDIRRNILNEWKSQRPEDFRRLNIRLADYFDGLVQKLGHSRETDTLQDRSNRDRWENEALYHHLVADPQGGEEKLQEKLAQEELQENQGRAELLLRTEQDATVDDYELFRQAIVSGNSDAWSRIVQKYHNLLLSWARRTSVQVRLTEPAEDIADIAIARAWSALSRARFPEFTTLASLLAYLRTCVSSVVIDMARGQASQERLQQRIGDDVVDPEERVVQAALEGEIWQIINKLLVDRRERIVITESFVLGLPPRTIATRYPDLFSSVSDVYATKRNVLARLQRNPELRRIFEEGLQP